jgi:hypothetical protein
MTSAATFEKANPAIADPTEGKHTSSTLTTENFVQIRRAEIKHFSI